MQSSRYNEKEKKQKQKQVGIVIRTGGELFTILMGITTLLKSHCNICVNAAADMNATSAFIDGFLVPHNEARNAVGVGALQWDIKLANYARNYARQRRGDCLLQHSDSPFGENIFWGSGHGWTPSQAVAAWIDEKKWFDYAKNICTGPDCTHYTQVVWRTTANVGCAKIICNSGDTFITCNYDPPGNYIASRPY